MKTPVRALIVVFALFAVTQCIFQRPEKNASYDLNCGGATIESAENCFKLEVMEIVAIVPQFTAADQTKSIDYYYKTTDKCSRDRLTGAARPDAPQLGGEICTLTPHASKLSALTSIVVTFVANCPGQGDFQGSSNSFKSSANPPNGSCSIELRTDSGFKGKAISTTAVLTVNIGVDNFNGGNAMAVRVSDRANCDADIKTIYGSGSLILYTDGTTTAMPVTGTWSYTGTGGSVSAAGVFTPSGVNGNFSGTVTYTGVTSKNINVAMTFPVTVSDGVYVTPGGSGNGCQNKPLGTVHSGIATGNALSPKRTVYATVGNYSFDTQVAGSISLADGVSIRGGYNSTFTGNPTPVATTRTCNATTMSCLMDTSTTVTFNRVISFGSGVTAATIVDGFFIAATSATTSGTTNTAIYSTGGTAIIQNNTIYGGAPSGTGNYTLTGIEAQSAITIRNNYIFGGAAPATAGSSTLVRGIYSINGLNGVIANNIIEAGNNPGRTALYALSLTNGCHPTITNNTIINGWGSAVFMEVYGGSVNPFDGKITNNIIAWGGTASNYGLHETHTFGAPRSAENNAFYPLNSTVSTIYNRASGAGIAVLEAYGSWIGGSDKARGNILLPTSTAGNPFVTAPKFYDKATGAGTTTSFVITNGGLYTTGDYVEINGDGVNRTINCGGPCTASISFTPATSVATATNAEIRNWGAVSTPTPDYQLQQNSLPAQDWENLRYGGKETSQSVCGAPGGGPGIGAGGESCGNVTTDRIAATRTTGVGGAGNTGAAGYSIGAYESP